MQRIHFPTLPSTHRWVKEQLERGGQKARLLNARLCAPWGGLTALVTCDDQSDGVGRRGHSWLSQRGDLAATYLLDSERAWLPAHAGLAGLLLAASLLQTLRELLGARAIHLKWPNDLQTDEGKLAGVLAEHTLGGKATLLSAGLNIAPPADVAGQPSARCASLKNLGYLCTAEQILAAWTPTLNRFLGELFEMGGEKWAQQIARRELPIGSEVCFAPTGQSPRRGSFADLDPAGRIGISFEGQRVYFSPHQVHHLRFSDTF